MYEKFFKKYFFKESTMSIQNGKKEEKKSINN